MHFYCKCLNVTINALETNDGRRLLSEILSDELTPYFNHFEQWLEFNLSSIHINWQALNETLTVRDKNINRCLACNTYTHITSNQADRILINKSLLNDNTVQNSYADRNYSKVVKIILPAQEFNSSMTQLPSETFQREYQLAQQLYRQSIDAIEQETEERIQMYQDEQDRILKKQKQIHDHELQIFLNLMRSMSQQTVTTKPAPILHKSNSYVNENSSMESGLGSDIFDYNGIDSLRPSSIFEETPFEQFDNSDDDIDHNPSSTNIGWSYDREISFSPPRSLSEPTNLIPANTNDNKNDIESIGRSFYQLSNSLVCTDGTELFGDLPSPRHNTRQT